MRMPNDSETEKPLSTAHRKSGSMWCESCTRMTVSVWTTTKFFKNGREIERQKCAECTNIQETEYWKGPTTRIKNKRK